MPDISKAGADTDSDIDERVPMLRVFRSPAGTYTARSEWHRPEVALYPATGEMLPTGAGWPEESGPWRKLYPVYDVMTPPYTAVEIATNTPYAIIDMLTDIGQTAYHIAFTYVAATEKKGDYLVQLDVVRFVVDRSRVEAGELESLLEALMLSGCLDPAISVRFLLAEKLQHPELFAVKEV